jgi:hypothetical protein
MKNWSSQLNFCGTEYFFFVKKQKRSMQVESMMNTHVYVEYGRLYIGPVFSSISA